jgi:hypothetical protein
VATEAHAKGVLDRFEAEEIAPSLDPRELSRCPDGQRLPYGKKRPDYQKL